MFTRLIKGLGAVFLLLTWTKSIAQERFAITFNGGCVETSSPLSGNTRFTEIASNSTEKLEAELRIGGWNVTHLYGSGNISHTGLTETSKSSDLDRPLAASKAQLLAAISHATAAGQNGDELLIAFPTHGMPGDAQFAHAFCANGGQEALAVDDPDLQKALASAKVKGLKIAFMDDSCFSGGSISHFQKFGCVLSSQSDLEPSITVRDSHSSDALTLLRSLTALLRERREGLQKHQGERHTLSLDDVFLSALWTSSRMEDGSSMSGGSRILTQDSFGRKVEYDSGTVNHPQSSDYPDAFALIHEVESLSTISSLETYFENLDPMGKVGVCVLQPNGPLSEENLKSLIQAVDSMALEDVQSRLNRDCEVFYPDSMSCKAKVSSTSLDLLRAQVKEAKTLYDEFQLKSAKLSSDMHAVAGPRVCFNLKILPKDVIDELRDSESGMAINLLDGDWKLKGEEICKKTRAGDRAKTFWYRDLLSEAQAVHCHEDSLCKSKLWDSMGPRLEAAYLTAYSEATAQEKLHWKQIVDEDRLLTRELSDIQLYFDALKGDLEPTLTQALAYLVMKKMTEPRNQKTDCANFEF